MKPLIYFLVFSITLFSCNRKYNEIELSKSFGNNETEKRFESLHDGQIIRDDSLRKIDFLNRKFLKLNSKSTFLSENDFDNGKGIFFREYSIKISDTIEIRVLQKQGKISEYVYIYKNKQFKIINYYGEMFSKNSDLFFDFASRKCYQIANNKYLMREQPIRWCGLANQFDFFQIADLDKMEIIQFADYDNKMQEYSRNSH
jgi:hypothetical protein